MRIVTALYDIGRETRGDGRSISQYLQWFDQTLKLNVPMSIFVEEKFEQFVKDRRSPENTEIVVQALEEIPYFGHLIQMEEILRDPFYQLIMSRTDRIECQLPLYNVIQYSKFEWITQSIKDGEEGYFWLDAGGSRFFDGLDATKLWKAEKAPYMDGRLLIQGNVNTEKFLHNWPGDITYATQAECILVGTFFGGNAEACRTMATQVKQVFLEYLQQGIINNEQIMLGILLKRRPDLFRVYVELNGQHLPLLKRFHEQMT